MIDRTDSGRWQQIRKVLNRLVTRISRVTMRFRVRRHDPFKVAKRAAVG
jgi:hypothetical protein